MRPLAKSLKPSLPLILLTIVLLFVQANADLALPDYLSRIVNTGIQQGGVENAVPQAIRQSELRRVLLFMSADDKTATLNDYTLVDQNSPDYERYLEQYPALADGPTDGAEQTVLRALPSGSQAPGQQSIIFTAKLESRQDQPIGGAPVTFYVLTDVFGERLMKGG